MKVTAKKKTLKVKALRKSGKVVKAITVKNAKGKVTYSKVSVTKKKFAKKFTVNKKNGKITVKKGLKKGKYKPRLLKSVVRYGVNYKTGKWKKEATIKYTYKKKYPSKVSVYNYSSEEKQNYRYKYTFSGKKPKSMKLYYNGEYISTSKYNGNGMVKQVKECNEDKTEQMLTLYSYHYKNYFTLKHFERVSDYSGFDGDIEYAEEDDSMKVTLRNGFLKKTVNKGMYANWTNHTAKKWYRFNGTYTAYYNKRGILRLQKARFSKTMPIGTTRPQDKFTLKWKNGRVVSAVHYEWSPDAKKGKGAWEKSEKFVFRYNKSKIGSVRYAAIINAQLQGASNYYEYKWY